MNNLITKKGTVCSPSLILFSLLYLAITDFLFFTGWFHPVFPIFFAIIMGRVLYKYYKQEKNKNQCTQKTSQQKISYRHYLPLIVGLLALTIYFVIAGVVGYFPTHSDSWSFRQALFLNLTNAPWPLVFPDGQEMTYYLAGMLPAATIARLLPDILQPWSILLWIMLPITITVLFFHQKRNANILIFIIMALGFQDPLRALFSSKIAYSGGGIISETLSFIQTIIGCDLSILHTLYGNQTILAPFYNCVGPYNSVPATLLVSVMIMHLKDHPRLIPLAIALLVPISPLGAIACMPIALYYYLPNFSLKFLLSILFPLVIVLLSAIYFLRADSDINIITLAWNVRGKAFWIFFIRYLIGATILLAPLYPTRKQDKLYYVISASVILLPLFFIGSTPHHDSIRLPGFNELFLKGIVVYSMIIVVMWYEDWNKIQKRVRYAALLIAIAPTLIFCYKQVKGWNSDCPVADMWNGHLYHKRNFLQQSIPKTVPPLIEGVILNKSGASEKTFPGCVLPAGGEVNYDSPPDPRAHH